MKNKKDLLTSWQITSLVGATVIGGSIMSLPATVAQCRASEALLATIIGGVGALASTYLVAKLGERFPNKTILDYSKTIVGTIITKIINALILIYFIGISARVIRGFALVSKLFLLEKTPLEVIILSLLLVSGYLVANGINPIARICEMFLPIMVFSLLLLLALSLQNFDIKEFYSVMQIDLMSTARIVPKTLLAYSGFELILFASAFAAQPKKLVGYSLGGTSIALVLYIATIIICIGVFTVDSLVYLMYPTLDLAKTISFPGAFAERFDIFFALFWVLAIFTSVSVFHYLAAFNLTKLLGVKNYRPFCYFLLPVIYFVSLVPRDIHQVKVLGEYISYMGFGIVFIAGILFIVSIFKRKGGEQDAEA